MVELEGNTRVVISPQKEKSSETRVSCSWGTCIEFTEGGFNVAVAPPKLELSYFDRNIYKFKRADGGDNSKIYSAYETLGVLLLPLREQIWAEVAPAKEGLEKFFGLIEEPLDKRFDYDRIESMSPQTVVYQVKYGYANKEKLKVLNSLQSLKEVPVASLKKEWKTLAELSMLLKNDSGAPGWPVIEGNSVKELVEKMVRLYEALPTIKRLHS